MQHLSIRLDRVTKAALMVLTADGTSATEAVRRAIIAAAEACPNPPSNTTGWLSRDDYIAAAVATAPPLSEYQQYVLHAAFIEQFPSWLDEDSWKALRRQEPGQ